MEDRKVILESAYYNTEDKMSLAIFTICFKMDCQLISVWLQRPLECLRRSPAAIRSRCLEVFFRGPLPEEIGYIARNAAEKVQFPTDSDAVEVVKNMPQMVVKL